MTSIEIQDNIEDIRIINDVRDFSEYKYSEDLSFIKINDYVVHQIELMNNSYEENVTNTNIDLSGVTIGDIFYLKARNLEIAEFTEFQFYAFLSECESSDLVLPSFSFKYNYLIVHQDYIDEFHLKYSSTSSIWGGFKITELISSISYYKKSVHTIYIREELRELDPFAQDSIIRALDQKHSFERFLKLYHLLELEFDYSLIKKIQTLNISVDSNQIGSLLNDYSRTETDRLLELVESTCTDVARLAVLLNKVKNHLDIAENIFIKFGKNKNSPIILNDIFKFRDLTSDPAGFESAAQVQKLAGIQLVNYNKFIHNVTSYWIYRIRCSIAHFKIGEYILTRDKEDFIVEFAEPLLLEVLIQFYKK